MDIPTSKVIAVVTAINPTHIFKSFFSQSNRKIREKKIRRKKT